MTLAWLLLGALQDWRGRRVSGGLVYLALFAGLLWRLSGRAEGTWQDVLMAMAMVGIGWRAGWVGGGDAKVTLAIALASVRLAAWAWAGVVGWTAVLHLVYGRDAPRRLPGLVGFAAGVAAGIICGLVS